VKEVLGRLEFKNGGPERIRTFDLLGANEALYQLKIAN